MWILLAVALLLLQFNKKASIVLLFITLVWAATGGVIDWRALISLAVVATLALAYLKTAHHKVARYSLELVLVVSAVGLTMHLIPGFHNPKVLESVIAGPLSVPFSMYYNFDKALVPFVLLVVMKSLFVNEPESRPAKPWWGLLVAFIPALLLLAVALGGLKIEPHAPQWLLPFLFANIFFVSLAEEALFRGYLQQRLSGFMHPVLALVISAAIFGGLHFAGGPLLIVFAALAGLIYGLAWMWSGRLWVAVAFHVGLNAAHLLFFTYPMLRHIPH
ncbi:CPBP family intramembrane metalloprotease [Cedecea davisae]|uniref:CPBP family intramembrane metalloprotease n=1 Tax=Cedecea davisae TaxID=158484 RepID=A0ABS6DJL9_9ENTR|nr:CPBP family intramembrane glutamic endopeptidase [Cedecea davisae]MBU4683411.1 CPBP family intramembrane metalloprotease [Cedecea davisae]MBU4685161.1 CPBP family intramembrane metalloprotease [Cedecea davisae]